MEKTKYKKTGRPGHCGICDNWDAVYVVPAEHEGTFELALVFCQNCGLVELKPTVFKTLDEIIILDEN